MRKLDIPEIFKREAENIIKKREESISVHGTGDIRAAGNDVEIEVRKFFKRILPKNLYVTNGHLIDKDGNVTPQIDLIITDNSNIPSLMTTSDGTEYIPIESVYAIGEIKSTYYKSKKYIESFSDCIKTIKEELFFEEIENTAYQGKMKNNTNMRDIFLGKGNKILNKLYTFMLFVDSGDFNFADISEYYKKSSKENLPSFTVILNAGIIMYSKYDDKTLQFARYPDEKEDDLGFSWHFQPFSSDYGSIEGNHLGCLYYALLNHISNSYLESPDMSEYFGKMMIGKKSKTIKAWMSKEIKNENWWYC